MRDYLTLVKRLTWEPDVGVGLCCASVNALCMVAKLIEVAWYSCSGK